MMPFTNVAVQMPSGARVSIMPVNDNKQYEISGLRWGPVVVSPQEAAAIRQILNVIIPDET